MFAREQIHRRIAGSFVNPDKADEFIDAYRDEVLADTDQGREIEALKEKLGDAHEANYRLERKLAKLSGQLSDVHGDLRSVREQLDEVRTSRDWWKRQAHAVSGQEALENRADILNRVADFLSAKYGPKNRASADIRKMIKEDVVVTYIPEEES